MESGPEALGFGAPPAGAANERPRRDAADRVTERGQAARPYVREMFDPDAALVDELTKVRRAESFEDFAARDGTFTTA